MARVYLNIGSNIQREKNIRSCIEALRQTFPNIFFSPIYETEAVGFNGDAFYNLAAGLDTELSFDDLEKYLKQLEDQHARQRDVEKFSARTLDIDILLYDDLILQPDRDIPRKEILKYPFVLFPLEDIAPDAIHPELKLSIANIVAQSDLNRSGLALVDLTED